MHASGPGRPTSPNADVWFRLYEDQFIWFMLKHTTHFTQNGSHNA